ADGRAAAVESRPWRLDPIPIVLDASTFRWLSLAVAERMMALDAVLADLYGDRVLVRERIVPPEVLAAPGRYRLDAIGSVPPRWLSTYAVDLALTTDGAWTVVQDLTDAPPGLGYALLDRSVMSRVWPEVMSRADVASLARFPGALRRALAATSAAESPRTVLFSGGLDHPSYVDHSFLAVQLGINLVEGADLVVRQRRVWLRTLERLEPVDVLYRRLDDTAIDPLEVGATGAVGVPGLMQAVRAGGVSVANAHGAGVLEDGAIRPLLDAAIARLRPMEQTLTQLLDGASIGRAPTFERDGVGVAPVVVRMFAVHDGDRVSVLPGATGRVLAPGDDPRFPTPCVAKDVWVQGQTVAPVIGVRLPQVDFGRSVPTRAADALYWTNRAAERAEAMTRTMRIISSRLEQDPGLASVHGGVWTLRMCRMAAAVRRLRHEVDGVVDGGVDGGPTLDWLREELSMVGGAVAGEIGSLLTEATTVREYLSVTTGRVLAHLAELRSVLQRHLTVVDDLDAVLADFAALAGLWQESTVRGPAWRIGDAGRRLERCLVVLDLVEAARPDADRGGAVDEEVDTAVTEVLLAANESLVAYRRRYRSDVEWDAAVELLVRDPSNPRSLAASIERLLADGDDGESAIGSDIARQMHAALALPVGELAVAMRPLVEEAGNRIVSRWFSTPVNPIVMRQREGDLP
ncbi:MAG TPA: circularly permuted type 2 ATP-grasp protein, partial [Ilumatobacter sp.]|nr:circularly permuted type 2 ATP-grasp protein [Ilumatobacter sp.]